MSCGNGRLIARLNSGGPECVCIVVYASTLQTEQEAERSESGSVLNIQSLVDACVANWRSQSTEFPSLGEPLERREQKRREARADRTISAVEAALRGMPRHDVDAQRRLQPIIGHVVSFIPEALHLSEDSSELRDLLTDGLAEVGLDLARRARNLDPAVSIVDTLQAARNAWVACGLQVMFGKRMRLTPSIFAYSMLYPYSDNFLDDQATTREDKLRFSERFERRLNGEQLAATSRRESIIWDLVGMIEGEYDRRQYPDVWASILAIHRAQTRSISQMIRTNGGTSRRNSPAETLELTVTKGGTSVLADAYLAAGDLTPFEAKVAFDWGVVLQLGDDLQDLHRDRTRGSLTLFTGASEFGMLDGVTNKTIGFSQSVMREVAELPECPSIMKSLLQRSSQMFLIRSVAGAGKFFSKKYVQRLEKHSPFRFSFLRSRERRFYSRRRDYGRLFENMVSDSDTHWLTYLAQPGSDLS